MMVNSLARFQGANKSLTKQEILVSSSGKARQADSSGAKETLPPSEAFEQLRALCMQLPGVEEDDSSGQITFRVDRRPFVVLETFRDPEGNYYRCLAFRASFFDHEQLSSDPDFFPAPYLGGAGWLGCRLEGAQLDRLSTLLCRSHRQIAGRGQDKIQLPSEDTQFLASNQ
jgi:predicted DNA-binding protein (MmcQ/YjbR family)